MTVFIAILILGVIIFFLVQKNRSSHPENENSKKQGDKQNLVDISTKTEGNITTMSIDHNEEELLRRIEDGTIGNQGRPEDKTIYDIVGFYGTHRYSSNGKFCVVYRDGYRKNGKRKRGQFTVLHEKEVLFKKRVERPHDCYVSNNGVAICCDWLSPDELTGNFEIFDKTGSKVFSKRTTANLGACGISIDGKIAAFETHNSDTEDADNIFVVDIEQRKLMETFNRPCSFIKIQVDSYNNRIKFFDNKNLMFETDFEGNQTNREEYEAQILQKGSIYDKLIYYHQKSDGEKFKDKIYIDVLLNAIDDSDSKYSFGKDRLYRMIGEYYEANNDLEKTIDYWEMALEINPKIGIKRKLDKLKQV